MSNPALARKVRRISRACDYCHRRSIRCRTSADGCNCQNCVDFAQLCTFDRKAKQRGVPPRKRLLTDIVKDDATQPVPSFSHTWTGQSKVKPWRAPHIASQATIIDLVELYFQIVYPMYPFFHQPTFLRSISRAEYATNKTLFAVTMAVCALASARARDGAISYATWDQTCLKDTASEVYYGEATRWAIEECVQQDHNLMRAHALLAITAMQYGKVREMHQHLGRYHTLVAIGSLHDENNWPPNLGLVEIEERRRLFWSMYTLDVYSCVVFGGLIRCGEHQCNVSYPTEVDDDIFDDDGFSTTASQFPLIVGSFRSDHKIQVRSRFWLSGWNFITDLYRVLEYAATQLRNRTPSAKTQLFTQDIFEKQNTAAQTEAWDRVMSVYLSLPECFRVVSPLAYDPKQDRFGLQATNITATIQLLKMVICATTGASIEKRCRTATEAIEAFAAIPVAYLTTVSTPLIHQIAVIGSILGLSLEESPSEADYRQLQVVMLSTAQLLSNLEVIRPETSTGENLDALVSRINERKGTPRALKREPRPRRATNSEESSSTCNSPMMTEISKHESTPSSNENFSSSSTRMSFKTPSSKIRATKSNSISIDLNKFVRPAVDTTSDTSTVSSRATTRPSSSHDPILPVLQQPLNSLDDSDWSFDFT